MQEFEIFRAGQHTAVNGATIGFSEADLDREIAVAEECIPARHEHGGLVPEEHLVSAGQLDPSVATSRS